MFSFLHPGFLFALTAVSIPIIIHLFHFRRFKKLFFSNTSFLSQIKTERQTRNRLKHLLILLFRILAIASLVFAFCQPFLRNPGINLKSGNTAISIYIDNSFSMENKTSRNSLLNEAKKIAGQIIAGSGKNDLFQVITNDFKIKQQRFYNGKDVQSLINEADVSPFSRNTRAVLLKQYNSLEEQSATNKIAYLISDFQKSTADLDHASSNKDIITYLVPVKPQGISNLLIDSAWFESPIIKFNQTAQLSVRLKNYSDKAVEESSIRLSINDNEKALSNFNMAAGQSLTLKLPFTVNAAGWNRGHLYITDYPVTFDDDYFFSFNVNPKINVLIINGNGSNPYLKSVFATDNYFSVDESNSNSIPFMSFKNYQLIILNELPRISSGWISELKSYSGNGGNILFIPSSDDKISPEDYKNFLTEFGCAHFIKKETVHLKASSVNINHPLLSGVFEKTNDNSNLPSISKYWERAAEELTAEVTLIQLENDQPLLTISPSGKGNILILSVPLDIKWSSLPRHAIFVPVLYQTALYTSQSLPLSYFIGKSTYAEMTLNDSGTSSSFKILSNGESFIPDYKFLNGKINLSLDDNFRKAGYYYLVPENFRKTDAKSLSVYPVISLNYDRRESMMDFYTPKDLAALAKEKGFQLINEKAGNLRYLVKNMDKGKPLWKLFIWLALAFLLAEIVTIRLWKS